jgi:hypothetical protein
MQWQNHRMVSRLILQKLYDGTKLLRIIGVFGAMNRCKRVALRLKL